MTEREAAKQMERAEYLAQLRALLTGRMAPEELERTLVYYEEYFDEAGPEEEARVIRELGDPAELVQDLMGERRERCSGPEAGEAPVPVPDRGGRKTPWKILLAICAAPIAIPLLLAGVVLAVGLLLVVAAAVLAVAVGGAACVAAGIAAGLLGVSVLFRVGIATTLYFVGIGLLASGVGLAVLAASFALAGLCFRGAAALLRRMSRRKEVQA